VGANELEFLERSGCAQCATKDFFSMVNGLVERGKWKGMNYPQKGRVLAQ